MFVFEFGSHYVPLAVWEMHFVHKAGVKITEIYHLCLLRARSKGKATTPGFQGGSRLLGKKVRRYKE